MLFEGKEGSSTVVVGHSALNRGYEGSPLYNLQDYVHDSCVVFIISWMVVGSLFGMLVVEGRVLSGV